MKIEKTCCVECNRKFYEVIEKIDIYVGGFTYEFHYFKCPDCSIMYEIKYVNFRTIEIEKKLNRYNGMKIDKELINEFKLQKIDEMLKIKNEMMKDEGFKKLRINQGQTIEKMKQDFIINFGGNKYVKKNK